MSFSLTDVWFPYMQLIIQCNIHIPSLSTLSLHYATIVQAMKFCPTVFMFGPPGAGKATAVNMALQLTGGISNRRVTNVTRPAILGYCAQSPFPIGIDRSSMSLLETLFVDLYKGA